MGEIPSGKLYNGYTSPPPPPDLTLLFNVGEVQTTNHTFISEESNFVVRCRGNLPYSYNLVQFPPSKCHSVCHS